ncbi:MAG: hypothetical protein IPL53_23415 [Ignavibacteria bacterium]|nr:hypothetical protein [Ignavibacteria bacterium]
MLRKIVIILFSGLCMLKNTYSQTNEEKILKGIDHIYSIEFDSAEIIFNEIIREDPKNPAGYFSLQWWTGGGSISIRKMTL